MAEVLTEATNRELSHPASANDSKFPGTQSNEPISSGVKEKKPFLKRGTRMPVSQLPKEGVLVTVKPIVTIGKVIPPVNTNETDYRNDSGKRTPTGASGAARRKTPTDSRPPTSSAKANITPIGFQMRQPAKSNQSYSATNWDEVAEQQSQDLDAFLRDFGPPTHGDDELDFSVVRASNDIAPSKQAALSHQAESRPSTAPVSALVKRHFYESANQRSVEAEEQDYPEDAPQRRHKAPPPPGTRKDSAAHLIYGNQSAPRTRPPAPPPAVAAPPAPSESDGESALRQRLALLDAQIEKFKRENEVCKKLRLERETALAQAERARSTATRELEAAEKEIEEQRASMAAERKKLLSDRDKQKGLAAQLKEAVEESSSLRTRMQAMEAEGADRARKHRTEKERLTSTIDTLQRKVAELETEVRSAGRLLLQQQQPSGAPAKPHTPRLLPERPVEAALSTYRSTISRGEETDAVQLVDEADEGEDDDVLSEAVNGDGRRDRTYRSDGRREALFPSGLRKVVWPDDGRSLVFFPNGDTKETTRGRVVYRYASTGAIQTTMPDGTEHIEFANGQKETHFPDGTKEILFPNGTKKEIRAE